MDEMDPSPNRALPLVRVVSTTVSSWWQAALTYIYTHHLESTHDRPKMIAGHVTGLSMALILLCSLLAIGFLQLLLLPVVALCALAWTQSSGRPVTSLLLHRLIARPHVSATITLVASELLKLSIHSTGTLTFADGALSHCAVMLQLFMAARGLPVSTRFTMLVLSSVVPFLQAVFLAPRMPSVLLLMGNTLGFLCGSAFTADAHALAKMAGHKTALQRADSRLLHLIKGQCGAAGALLKESIRHQDKATNQNDAHAADSRNHLQEQVLEMLTQTSEWCYKREVFVQLEDGTYKSELREAHMHGELRAALGPHTKIDTFEQRVMVDTLIMRLLLNEVSTNAAKYSPSQKHISAEAKLVQDDAGKEWLHISVRNSNLPGSPHLSPRECEQVFEKGFKKNIPSAAGGRKSQR